MEWQPIETAPKDREVLLFDTSFKKVIIGWYGVDYNNSNNNEKATDFEYTSEYNLDGKDCKNTVSYSFGENDCVIAISNPLQNEEAVKSASLKKSAKIIYSY